MSNAAQCTLVRLFIKLRNIADDIFSAYVCLIRCYSIVGECVGYQIGGGEKYPREMQGPKQM